MNSSEIVKKGSNIHGVLLGAATVLWGYTFLYGILSAFAPAIMLNIIDIVVTVAYIAVSVWCLTQGLKLSAENKKLVTGSIKGIGAIVPSAIVSIVSGITCYFLGIILTLIVWIVSGIAIRNLSKIKETDDFKDRLTQN